MAGLIVLRKRGQTRIELAEGVALTVTPIGASDVEVATAIVSAHLAQAVKGVGTMERYGLGGEEAPAMQAMVASTKQGSQGLLAMELGNRHIKAWEGVTTDGETLAEITPANIAMLFSEWGPGGESFGSIFLRKISALSVLEPGAGKDSAASQDTSTAAAAKGVDAAG